MSDARARDSMRTRAAEPKKSLLRWPVYGCALVVLLVVGGLLLVRYTRGQLAIKDSGGYRLALLRAHADKELTDALGGDFAEPWFVRGRLVRTVEAETDLEFWALLKGPLRSGQLHAWAHEKGGSWKLVRTLVAVPPAAEESARFDLSDAASVGSGPKR